MADIQQRKQQHIQLALEEGSQGKRDLWAEVQLPYKALPEIDLQDVDCSTSLLGKKLRQPLVIASMTGGSTHAEMINMNLARAAEEMKVAMGVGSQRVALEEIEAAETFALVRKYAPTTVIFANMGAVQLNYGRTIDDYQKIVEMVKADALYLHINPMQEAVQPEGDTNFSGLLKKIEKLVREIKVPVWAKEVGNGLDEITTKKLLECGVKGIDVAGVGGTSWTWIEGQRAKDKNLTEWFADFGWPTDVVLPKLAAIKGTASLVASGGVRNPVQGLKAHLLGADYYSAARPFLEPAMTSSEELIKLLGDWEKGLKIVMFGCGLKKWKN